MRISTCWSVSTAALRSPASSASATSGCLSPSRWRRAGSAPWATTCRSASLTGLSRGESHIIDVPAAEVEEAVTAGRFAATTDPSRLAACDTISICVPTPLGKTKDPDLSYVVAAAETVATVLRRGQLVILESTTFPGTTREIMLPILERSGLRVGEDFFLCFSPERVDPGNAVWTTKNTPKVIGGVTPRCIEAGHAIYQRIFDTLVPVPNAEAAELVKLYENTFRMINIALVNELAQVCEKLDVDVWDVIDAAATKPFGFMKFTPGPGLGGHCIPLDPHYLVWKMKTLAYKTRMIEVASEVNSEMPRYVVRKVADALNTVGRPISGSRVLIVGMAYKKDVDDLRESPALEIMSMLQQKGAVLAYHDPFCSVIGTTATRCSPDCRWRAGRSPARKSRRRTSWSSPRTTASGLPAHCRPCASRARYAWRDARVAPATRGSSAFRVSSRMKRAARVLSIRRSHS
jgi:nucleotide sugar dehydrogenase